MAVVKKKVTTTKAAPTKVETKETKKVVKPAVKTVAKAAPAKTVAKPAAKAAPKKDVKSVAKKSVAKPAVKETKATGGKKSLKNKNKKVSTSFTLVKGKQATQDQFLHIFYNKLSTNLGYELTKEDARGIQKAYSETLKEVTDICSFQDTTSGIYYARRIIGTRVTQPPKAADGLQTLMLQHAELKVRKLLDREEDIKFFGHVSDEDDTIFITTDGDEISLVDPVEDAEEEVAEEDEEVVETEEDEEAEEATEELEEEVAEEDEESEEDEEDLFEEEEE